MLFLLSPSTNVRNDDMSDTFGKSKQNIAMHPDGRISNSDGFVNSYTMVICENVLFSSFKFGI